MLEIITIIGARPQFIKAAAVSRAIAKHNMSCAQADRLREIIVHTGQHYDENMSQIFFDELHIPKPDYCLEVGSGRHGEQTGAMLQRIEEVLLEVKPSLLMVYGDTNSTLAGVLAAVKQHVPTVHVEAGLRSYNRFMPEEINRIIADQIANVLLCPTVVGVENLRNEGINGSGEESESFDLNTQCVHMVGDVMFDSVLFNGQIADKKSHIVETLGLSDKYVLATLHRAENTDDPSRLEGILQAICHIAKTISVVLPLHPRTRKCIARSGMDLTGQGLMIIEPVGYLDMLRLEKNASLIITDSGGVQKEAYFMRVPCITLREETEWTETVALGWNCLTGADPEKIAYAFERVNRDEKIIPPFDASLSEFSASVTPYGNGKAAEKIVATIVAFARKMFEPAKRVI